MARISIVIPFFNSHATLGETLDSLSAQSFRDFEIILVDDGSTATEAQACLAALPAAVTLMRQTNHGLPGARNAGIRAARGEFVLPLDSDDKLAPTALAQLLAALDTHPDADLAFSWTRRFGEEDGISPMALNPFEQLIVNEAPYCMLMRRGLIARAGGYDETMRDGYEDWEFNIRLVALRARAIVLSDALFLYRVRRTGMLRARSWRQHAEIWRSIRRRHPALYGLPQMLDAWRRGRRARAIWPLPALAIWGVVLLICPPALINPAYRAGLLLTRGLRDRYKARMHGSS